MRKLSSSIAIFIMVVLGAGCSETGPNERTIAPGRSPTVSARQWYAGGTLHDKTALEWQTASPADKLATCADFVAAMSQAGNLKPSITDDIATLDDVRPYAQELVDFLDAAFKRLPNAEENHNSFVNQSVSSTAAMGMAMIGWTK